MRVHAVPRNEFEQQVESDNPPTITELARQGTKPRPETFDMLQGRDPDDFQAATGVLELLSYAIEKIDHLDLARSIRGMNAREKGDALKNAKALHEWLESLILELEG